MAKGDYHVRFDTGRFWHFIRAEQQKQFKSPWIALTICGQERMLKGASTRVTAGDPQCAGCKLILDAEAASANRTPTPKRPRVRRTAKTK